MSSSRTVSARSSSEAIVAVIEDDPAARRALTRMLRAQGVRVASFASAEEFLHALTETGPACLVIDVVLPGMSGADLLDRLRADGVHLPAIFVTGSIDATQMLRRRGLGDVPCLHKPFEPGLLVQAVSRALEGAS
jgi:FixJ family two-component response regulator